MTNNILNLRKTAVWAFAISVILVSGSFFEANAQRDPFLTPGYQKQKTDNPSGNSGTAKSAKPGQSGPAFYGAPAIEARIDYYKRVREQAAANGQPLPKVTSVLTLNELAVSGIFKTPRGYAAIVEATPIKLSYTIYPGEKFFDGQLVAVEENRLVFRKITKTGPNKFVASVENKALQQFNMRSQIQGTAPANQPSDKDVQTASAAAPAGANAEQPVDRQPSAVVPAHSGPIVSFLDEMNRAPADTGKAADKKASKKPAKVAKSNK